MNLRRVTAMVTAGEGVVASYVHGAVTTGPGQDRRAGRPGVRRRRRAALQGCRQATWPCTSPSPATRSPSTSATTSIAAALERERNVLSEQARESGKPEEIIAKMVEGRLRKYYEEICPAGADFRHRWRDQGLRRRRGGHRRCRSAEDRQRLRSLKAVQGRGEEGRRFRRRGGGRFRRLARFRSFRRRPSNPQGLRALGAVRVSRSGRHFWVALDIRVLSPMIRHSR